MIKMLKMSTSGKLLDKIRGSMVGAVIGDCLGSPVECQYWEGIEVSTVIEKFIEYRVMATKSVVPVIEYTDDTAMARQVALSLIEKKCLDPFDLAERFWIEYYEESFRGYGATVIEVFKKLKLNLDRDKDPFRPASEQFDGSGSYGNGAAMRVHPVGLFFDTVDKIIDNSKLSARITHANCDGINGAVLQAVATHCALTDKTSQETLQVLKELAKKFDAGESKKCLTYLQQLEEVERMLKEPEHNFSTGFELGNSVSAIESVPTAIYSFLRGQHPVKGLETQNPFERSLQLAMTFGGDSDTICSMTGALSGAKYGESEIPEYMPIVCEGIPEAKRQAEKIHEILIQRPQI